MTLLNYSILSGFIVKTHEKNCKVDYSLVPQGDRFLFFKFEVLKITVEKNKTRALFMKYFTKSNRYRIGLIKLAQYILYMLYIIIYAEYIIIL